MKRFSRPTFPTAHWGLLLLCLLMPAAGRSATCLECHASPELKVRAPRLLACYQAWKDSPHAHAKVGCADCHGGAEAVVPEGQCPSTAGGMVSDFRRVPESCGRCHQEILAAFRDSRHFARLQEGKLGSEGPNCVTCHGSMGASRVETSHVEALCATCHDGLRAPDESIPRRARSVLENLLSIRQFSAWLELHAKDPDLERRERTRQITLWHHFDLVELESQSARQVEQLKARVHDVRSDELEKRREQRLKDAGK